MNERQPRPFPQPEWEKDFNETERHLFPPQSEFAQLYEKLPDRVRKYINLCYTSRIPTLTSVEKREKSMQMADTLTEMQQLPDEMQAYLGFVDLMNHFK